MNDVMILTPIVLLVFAAALYYGLKHAGLDEADRPARNIRAWWRFFFGR